MHPASSSWAALSCFPVSYGQNRLGGQSTVGLFPCVPTAPPVTREGRPQRGTVLAWGLPHWTEPCSTSGSSPGPTPVSSGYQTHPPEAETQRNPDAVKFVSRGAGTWCPLQTELLVQDVSGPLPEGVC